MERNGNVVRPNFSSWKSEQVQIPVRRDTISLPRSPLESVDSVHRPDSLTITENIAPLLHRPNKETVGSDSFNLEYDSPPTPAELRRDIVSYLSEYRLQVQKHPYQLLFGRRADRRGPITLRDQDGSESLSRKAERSIISRRLKKQPTHREEAELEGIDLLNEQLRFSQDGDTVIWASPPGSKEQGYGDYGFLYVGKITKFTNNEASLAMQAIRIENPSLEQYNQAFSALTGERIDYQDLETFLSRPRLVHQDISGQTVDKILQNNFSFTLNDEDRERADRIIERMDPMIEDFLVVMQEGTKEERLKAFYALENYALKLKEQEVESQGENVIYINSSKEIRLQDVIEKFGFMPPVVGGSCGSSGGSAFSNSLTSISGSESIANAVFGEDQYGSLEFECTKGHKNTRPRGQLIPNCTTCGESVAC